MTTTDRAAHYVLLVLSVAALVAALFYAAPAWGFDAGPVAIAAPAAPDPGADPAGWAGSLYDAVRGGRWAMVAGLVLVGAVYAVRRWVLKSWAWAQTGVGGLVTVAGLGVLGMLANAGIAGRWPDAHAWAAAAEAIVTAIAAYVAARKVAGAPSSKAPAAAVAS